MKTEYVSQRDSDLMPTEKVIKTFLQTVTGEPILLSHLPVPAENVGSGGSSVLYRIFFNTFKIPISFPDSSITGFSSSSFP